MPCFSKRFCVGLIPVVLACTAFICTFVFGFWCETVKYEPIPSSSGSETEETFRFGPWTKQETQAIQTNVGGQTILSVTDACVYFPDSVNTDSKWKTVRAFTVITPIIGGLLIAGLFLNNCLYFMSAATWKFTALTFSVILTLFQGLTFLFLQSSACTREEWDELVNTAYQDECSWDKGMSANVAATVCWFLTGVAMLVVGCPERPERPPPETQEVTYQQTTNPDGTTTVSKVGVVKGTAVPKEDPVAANAADEGPTTP